MNKGVMMICIEYDEEASSVGEFIDQFGFRGLPLEEVAAFLKSTKLISVRKIEDRRKMVAQDEKN